MPELPEVETARRLARRVLTGHRIVAVATVDDPIVYAGVSPRRLAAALRGRRVEAVGRKGKHFWLELDRRPWPAFHFGMSGSLRVYGDASERPRYWKLELQSEDGARLAIRDPRRLGRIRLLRDPAREPPISRLGFDVLEEMPGPRQLHGLLSRRRGPIKAVLLDQGLFAGVGNWIADEALYQARISPHRPAASLKPAEVARLRRRLAAIVVLAVRVLAAEKDLPRGWLFHRRWSDSRPQGRRAERIVRETIGGRTAAWVPARQR